MKHWYELTKAQQTDALSMIEVKVSDLLKDGNLFPEGHKMCAKKVARMAAEGSTYNEAGVLEESPLLN